MGQLVKGKWVEGASALASSAFGHRIGSGGFAAQAGRYHLYVSHRCPFAHAALAARNLKGLEGVVSMSAVAPQMGPKGWTFGQGDTADPNEGCEHLYELYVKANPEYTGRVTTPILWDTHNKTLVSKESGELISIFNQDFGSLASNNVDLEPEAHMESVQAWESLVMRSFMPAITKCKQASKENASKTSESLKAILKKFEDRLKQQDYLACDHITRADIRFFAPLVRFDALHLPAFKDAFARIGDSPPLAAFLKRLLSTHELERTVHWKHIKAGL